MPAWIVCPACGHRRVVPSDCVGRSVMCQECNVRFTAIPPRTPKPPKSCPFCSGSIRHDATECPRCGEALDGDAKVARKPSRGDEERVARKSSPQEQGRRQEQVREGEVTADGPGPGTKHALWFLLLVPCGCCGLMTAFNSRDGSPGTPPPAQSQPAQAGGTPAAPVAQPADTVITYSTLKSTTAGNGKVYLSILVSESATKAEVMKLAAHLMKKHEGKFNWIMVFDSREAYQLRSGDGILTAAQEAFIDRHWLLQAYGPGQTDGDLIVWVAEGRNH